jgi:uncharacterized protein (TIGR00251 family)
MLTPHAGSVLLAVRVKPRSPSERIEGERAGRLLVSVTAPPVEGRANEAVCRLLANKLGVARGRVTVVSGSRGRDKLVRVDGLSPREAAGRLGLEDQA